MALVSLKGLPTVKLWKLWVPSYCFITSRKCCKRDDEILYDLLLWFSMVLICLINLVNDNSETSLSSSSACCCCSSYELVIESICSWVIPEAKIFDLTFSHHSIPSWSSSNKSGFSNFFSLTNSLNTDFGFGGNKLNVGNKYS